MKNLYFMSFSCIIVMPAYDCHPRKVCPGLLAAFLARSQPVGEVPQRRKPWIGYLGTYIAQFALRLPEDVFHR